MPGTYISPAETGLYYLKSRYYDPEIKRFLSPDVPEVLTAAPMALSDKNLYAYCDNNPVVRSDGSGKAWESIFDVLSLAASVMEVAFNPADPWAWMGLAGDAVDLIPFVTGVGESIRTLKTTSKLAEGTDDAIDTYRNLKKLNVGNDLEVHHIVEKRFKKRSDIKIKNTNDMYSIALPKDVHRNYTNKWRTELKYGKNYKQKDVLATAIRIYQKEPTMLGAAILTIVY